MTARILEGRTLAAELRTKVRRQAADFRHRYGYSPQIAAVMVGAELASSVYVQQIVRTSEQIGLKARIVELPRKTTADELRTEIERLNADPANSKARVIDIDLPPMIALKRELLAPHPRHELLAASVLDHDWMNALDRYDDRRYIFLAEGLLMYFPPAEVKRLVITLATRFPGSELVADLFNGRWLRPPWRSWVTRKMQRQLHFDREASFEFGLDSPNEMATWHPRIHFLDEWSLLDAHERKLGPLRWLRHIPLARLAQYIVHYQLG